MQDCISTELLLTKKECDKEIDMYFNMEALVYTERIFHPKRVGQYCQPQVTLNPVLQQLHVPEVALSINLTDD